MPKSTFAPNAQSELAQEKHICLKSAKIQTKQGQKIYYYDEWIGKLKGITFKLRFILTQGVNENGQIFSKLLVSNDLTSLAKEIIQGYSLRWNIETTFQRLKDYFYLDQFQVRSVKAFSRHYYLAMVAYSFVLMHLMCGSFAKISPNPTTTFEQAIFLLRDLITLESFHEAATNVRLILRNKDLRLKKSQPNFNKGEL